MATPGNERIYLLKTEVADAIEFAAAQAHVTEAEVIEALVTSTALGGFDDLVPELRRHFVDWFKLVGLCV